MDINPQTADFAEYGKQVRVHALDDVMNALNSAKPSRVINLAYLLGSDPLRGRFAVCRRPLDWRSVTLRRRR